VASGWYAAPMAPAPQLSPHEEDDDDEWEEAPLPEAPPATAPQHPYRAPAVREGDTPRRRKRRSPLTAIVAATGGVVALGVMYALTRVPVQRPAEPVVTALAAPTTVPKVNETAVPEVSTAPAPTALIASQRDEVDLALAYEREDYAYVEATVLPHVTKASCSRLHMLATSCNRLHHWYCARRASAELADDGCLEKRRHR